MPEFKYRDYYSVFGLENAEFVTPADATGLDAILEKMGCYERPGLEEVKARLLASFPFGVGYTSPKAKEAWGIGSRR